jgi:hypothetical protein
MYFIAGAMMSSDPNKLSLVFMNTIPIDVRRGGEKWMVNAAIEGVKKPLIVAIFLPN